MRYAVPQPYFEVANATDVPTLKRQLADAEQRAARANDWTTRTRAQQDVKELTQKVKAAQVDRRAQPAANTLSELPYAVQQEVIRAAMTELRRVGAAS